MSPSLIEYFLTFSLTAKPRLRRNSASSSRTRRSSRTGVMISRCGASARITAS